MSIPSLLYQLEQQLQFSQTRCPSSGTMVARGPRKRHTKTVQTAPAKNEALKKTMQRWSPQTIAKDTYRSMKKAELLYLIVQEEEKSLKSTRFQMLARGLMRKLGHPGSHPVPKRSKKEDFILRLKFLTGPLPSFQSLSVMSALLHDSHLQKQASSTPAVAISAVLQELMQVDEHHRQENLDGVFTSSSAESEDSEESEDAEDELAALPAGASEANENPDEAALVDCELDEAELFGDDGEIDEAELFGDDGEIDEAALFGDAEAEAHPPDAFDSMTISDEEYVQEEVIPSSSDLDDVW